EWALAEGVCKYVASVARGRRFRKVRIALGELQSIDKDVFRFALTELLKAQGFEVGKDVVEFVVKHAVLQCRRCGRLWRLSEADLSEDEKEAVHFIPEVIHAYASCPECGSRDFEVIEGRGVEILEVLWE
ncbi:MAG: hydrogenase nickel incorporation protein HypA, partial [Zestosphaera sp.]